MKNLMAILFLFSVQAFAADLNLNGGESVIIQPNVTTKVTCGGGSVGGSCGDIAAGFKAQLEACQNTYSGGYCFSTYWTPFKNSNEKCYYAGIAACVEACQKTYSGGYCADKCQ